MSHRKTQAFLVAPIHQDAGLTSVALGIVCTLQRLGVEVGFAKPVAQEDTDCSCNFAKQIFSIDAPESITLATAAERIASNQTADLLEDIVALCMKASEKANILVIEGLHADATHTFAPQMNIDIANSLKAEVILVGNGSLPNAVNDIKLSARQFVREGCKVAGAVLNMAPEEFDNNAAKAQLGGTKLWGVVHETPQLHSPRTLDVARHLNAEIVSEGELATRRVHNVVVAARSATQYIPHLKPGSLVITSGDRDNIILTTAADVKRSICLDGSKMQCGIFFGDSVLGCGARVGSGVITANRKFNQTEVYVSDKQSGKRPSGREFFGAIIGRYCRLGANVVTYPGTIVHEHTWIGAGCVLHGSYGPDQFITVRQELDVRSKERLALRSGKGEYEHV